MVRKSQIKYFGKSFRVLAQPTYLPTYLPTVSETPKHILRNLLFKRSFQRVYVMFTAAISVTIQKSCQFC